jgi:predicted RNA methylase
LRLWIELLKNAYYKNATELETLPNIDINIKCGNSLVSRFAIDADLKQALKKSKWTIDSYRIAVDTYRNAESKEQKREMERLIADIKSDFRSEISLNDPKLNKLRKLSGELFQMTQQTQLFEMSKKEKADWNKKVTKLTEETKKLENEIEEIKANKIFENAFEWRFEFPEVLNDDGDFVGFDLVIGNPPYGVKLSDREKEYLKNRFTATSGEVEIYIYFIELAMTDLLKQNGVFSFITTNTIYYLDKFSQIRKNAFLGNRVISLLELEKQVFADAPDIVPAIYVLQKNTINKNVIKLYKSTETKRVYDLVEFEGFKINSIEQNKFETKTDFVFSLSTNEAKENLLKKISQLEPIKKSFKVIYGIKTGDNERFLSKEVKGTENWKKCASSAKNIKKYTIDWQGDYLNVCSDLAGLNNINYEQPKILIQYIRKLSMPVRLVCALDSNGEYYPLNNFSFVISENGNSLKVLLGILNSRLMNWYFSNSFVDYNIKPKYIEKLPLPTKIISSELETKVTEIISLKVNDKEIDTADLENQINQLVYQLYDLTEEEIKIVEGV